MVKGSSQSKAAASAPAAKLEQGEAMVVVAKVGGQDVLVPQLSRRQQAAADAMEQYRGYVNIIDSEELKVWLTTEVLIPLKTQLNEAKRELKGITDPLQEIRRQALVGMNNANNAFAAYLTHLETGEAIVKTEILRWDDLQERKRLEAEAELRRAAEAEQRRIEAEARKEAEAAAAQHRAEQERVAELERQGQQEKAEQLRAESEATLVSTSEAIEAKTEEAAALVDNVHVASESVALRGVATAGRWEAEVVDPLEVLAGIVDKSTPLEALRVKVKGKLTPVNNRVAGEEIQGIEINLPFFHTKAREQEKDFNYRGMKAKFVRNLRVTA